MDMLGMSVSKYHEHIISMIMAISMLANLMLWMAVRTERESEGHQQCLEPFCLCHLCRRRNFYLKKALTTYPSKCKTKRSQAPSDI